MLEYEFYDFLQVKMGGFQQVKKERESLYYPKKREDRKEYSDASIRIGIFFIQKCKGTLSKTEMPVILKM